MKGIRRHLTYSNVMVTGLLLVVLGGSAYALGRNTVGSKQIRNGGVKSIDIANGTVGVSDLAAGVRSGLNRIATTGVRRVGAVTSNEAGAPAIDLLTRGPFTLYGKCHYNTTNSLTYGSLFIRTTAGGALAFGANYAGGFDSSIFLEPNTAEDDRQLTSQSGPGIADNNGESTAGAVTVVRGSQAYSFSATVFYKGNTSPGSSVNYGGSAGRRCVFVATVIDLS